MRILGSPQRKGRVMIDWTFNDPTGKRLLSKQTENTETAFEDAGAIAQRLANKHQTTVSFTAWLEDREGSTAYRYPRKRGRPTTGNAKTAAERVGKLRSARKAAGLCPCCGKPL